MSGIVWEDPGPDRRTLHVSRGSQWDDVLARLREHPGQWARIATYAQQGNAARLAYRIRRGEIASARPTGSFESTSRGRGDGDAFAVYARYVGTAEAGS